ncbi:hypothetical protein GOV04_04080 [Candidatus Woesearchaeota archaeon]|nr:hypothetical protein [Candidatus Woesearchaeota archaeon]
MAELTIIPYNTAFNPQIDSTTYQIYARGTAGKKICLTTKNVYPRFYIKLKPVYDMQEFADRIKQIKIEWDTPYTVIDTTIKERLMRSKPTKLIEVQVNVPRAVSIISNILKKRAEVEEIYEADLLFRRKYSLGKKINLNNLYNATAKLTNTTPTIDFYELENLEPQVGTIDYEPKILSFSMQRTENGILAISTHIGGITKTFSWKKPTIDSPIQSEQQLINAFKHYLQQTDYDIITGYYSDKGIEFLQKRAHRYKIKLDLSIDGQEINFVNYPRIYGCNHIDLNPLLKTHRKFLSSKALELEQQLLELSTPLTSQAEEMSKKRAVILHELCKETLPFLLEYSKITSMPIEDIARFSGQQLGEWYLIKKFLEAKQVIPLKRFDVKAQRPRQTNINASGLYKDQYFTNITLLAPMIMAHYNIDENKKNCDCCPQRDSKNHGFCMQKKGTVPKLLEELGARHKKISQLKTESQTIFERADILEDLAYHIYSNLASPTSRWFSPEVITKTDEVLTEYLQRLNRQSITYKDYETLFVEQEAKFGSVSRWPELLRLDFEKADKVFFANNKYALTIGQEFIMRGFDYKRNTSRLNAETQEKILRLLLFGDVNTALEHAKNTVKALQERQINKQSLMISNVLTRDLPEYESKDAHITIAKDLEQKGHLVRAGTLINYYVSNQGNLVREKARTLDSTEPYDIDYYLNNQLMSMMTEIFSPLGITKEQIIQKVQNINTVTDYSTTANSL